MSVSTKFKKITDWYAAHATDELMQLRTAAEPAKLDVLQGMITAPLPDEFKELYLLYNGEQGQGMGAFLGHSFASLDQIISSTEFAVTLVKPANRFIANPKESDQILREIINTAKAGITAENWYRLEFQCSPSSLGGPYLYPFENTASIEREMPELQEEAQEQIFKLAARLHALEKEHYNWDELEIVVFGDTTFNVERKDFNFDADIPFTSYPEGAIRKKYFNLNWVPVISDSGGNYIGIDLDPDVNGKAGQIIVFGRDEEDMFVIADSLEDFLDYVWTLLEKGGAEFLASTHLHDIFKKLIVK